MTTQMTPAQQLAAFVLRYGPAAGERGPELMVEEVFGVIPDDWQRETLRAYARGERRMSIRSCHGVGKTAVLSWMAWHMLLTKFPQNTIVTAPTKGQLEDALVAEVMSCYAKLPPALQSFYETKKNRIELKSRPADSFFSAATAREEKPEALQGKHSDHVLLIADEASGVPEAIFEAAVGSMSGHNATTVLASNPTRTTGLFYESQTRLKGSWWTIHVKAEDSPRVSQEFVEQVAETYGRDSNAFRVRVLGEFPKSDDDTIIPFELIDAARNRDIVMREDMVEVWGLDVARYGGDENVLVRRNKIGVLPRIESWGGLDLMETAGKVFALWKETPPSRRPSMVCIDAIGLGAGVADRLQELGVPVASINVSEKAGDERYKNLRTELWFRGRDWLAARTHTLPSHCECERCAGKHGAGLNEGKGPHHVQLEVELAAQKYRYLSEGKIHAMAKSDMKKVIKRSPNVADAFLLTLAEEPISLIHGSAGSNGWNVGWNQPLQRELDMV